MVELALGMAVLALVAGAVTPIAVRYVRQEAGQKTAREMRAVLDAGKAFYVANNRWPASLAELQSAGHLPAILAQSPFGTGYDASAIGAAFQVTVSVPTDMAASITRIVPLTTGTASGASTLLTATTPVPGASADSSLLLHRQGTLVSSTMLGPLELADQSPGGGTNIRSLGSNAKNFFEGNVGIGTASPGTKLDVRNDGIATDSAVLNLLSGSSGNSQINLWTAAEADRNRIKSYPDRVSIGAGGQAEALHVRDNSIGIGTTSPAARLHVYGDSIKVTHSRTQAEVEIYPSNWEGCAPGYFVLGVDPQSGKALCANLP